MENDDTQRGRVLTRREALALVGATGVAMLVPRAAGKLLSGGASSGLGPPARGDRIAACIARPAQTEGPYFVDELLNRSDIRSDPSDGSVKPGAELRLTLNVSGFVTGGGCIPLDGVYVDLWHCDALGVYSDVQDPGFDTQGMKFLRGYQVTDSSGGATFTTIYPGWYQGRTVHMHFKLRSAPTAAPGFEFTSQLYFDDTLTDQVHAEQPYAAKGQRTLRNSGDGIYGQGASQLFLAATQESGHYAATFDISLQDAVAVDRETWSGLKKKYI